MLEFYQAYADYRDMMDLTEQLIKSSAENVLKKQKLTISLVGEDDSERDAVIDLSQPFTRMSVIESILKFNPTFDSEVLDDITRINEYTKRLGIDVRPSWGLGKIQTEIFEKTVESKLIQPTFITMYPAEVSPLARRNDENPFVTDRFEFFVGGQEIANGFSELNDPEDQAQRFKDQVKEKELGDEEAMYFDDDYIRALEFGMPPTAGEGIGIDRLVMLFTNSTSIKDVILFPHMRPES
jgi:lysyl-tRNA synthetase class 2